MFEKPTALMEKWSQQQQRWKVCVCDRFRRFKTGRVITASLIRQLAGPASQQLIWRSTQRTVGESGLRIENTRLAVVTLQHNPCHHCCPTPVLTALSVENATYRPENETRIMIRRLCRGREIAI